ncbi:hypothetical protein GCM10009850_004270 [Nonomuraea monospora]|uniref:Uncharacterized protein n=1 Tax=Nonomuraea monospora TaxID=568818 RepID=A0ABP5NY98_9ACTN
MARDPPLSRAARDRPRTRAARDRLYLRAARDRPHPHNRLAITFSATVRDHPDPARNVGPPE